jgi:hypothetical protein
MADRRSFLGAVSGVAATLVLSEAGAGAATSPAPQPAPTASAAKPISPAARAQAEAMRAFDPHLSEAQLETIARGIDAANAAGGKLNARGRVLHNGDEPVTSFFVDEVSA